MPSSVPNKKAAAAAPKQASRVRSSRDNLLSVKAALFSQWGMQAHANVKVATKHLALIMQQSRERESNASPHHAGKTEGGGGRGCGDGGVSHAHVGSPIFPSRQTLLDALLSASSSSLRSPESPNHPATETTTTSSQGCTSAPFAFTPEYLAGVLAAVLAPPPLQFTRVRGVRNNATRISTAPHASHPLIADGSTAAVMSGDFYMNRNGETNDATKSVEEQTGEMWHAFDLSSSSLLCHALLPWTAPLLAVRAPHQAHHHRPPVMSEGGVWVAQTRLALLSLQHRGGGGRGLEVTPAYPDHGEWKSWGRSVAEVRVRLPAAAKKERREIRGKRVAGASEGSVSRRCRISLTSRLLTLRVSGATAAVEEKEDKERRSVAKEEGDGGAVRQRDGPLDGLLLYPGEHRYLYRTASEDSVPLFSNHKKKNNNESSCVDAFSMFFRLTSA